MAGSLLPVGKAVLRSRQPSNCYIFNANLQHPKSIPILLSYNKRAKQNSTLNKSVLLSALVCQYRLKPVSALDSDVPRPIDQVLIPFHMQSNNGCWGSFLKVSYGSVGGNEIWPNSDVKCRDQKI